MNDIARQKPWTVNQISNDKPSAPRTDKWLSGYIGGSMNGGHNITIGYKEIMAGEKHREMRIRLNMKMLTPKTPTYQQLKCTVRAYFVPNSRVWENAEKYTAQKGGASEIKVEEVPNMKGKTMQMLFANSADPTREGYWFKDTTAWRDSFISSYISRIGGMTRPTYNSTMEMPRYKILGLRGRVAIYNDFERNKEYDPEKTEYKTDEVTQTEWNSYFPLPGDIDYYFCRAKRENNYYTDYRTEMQGFGTEQPDFDENSFLVQWASLEAKIAEARSQAQNSQMTDWAIIAKLRGSKLLSEGKVQLIGKKTFNMNYAAVTQNAYNNNEEIQESFRVLGQQGAYSYTEIEFPIYAGMEFKEEGMVHFIATVSADSVFESGLERTMLNCSPLEEYRPDLESDKLDVLYKCEMGTVTDELNNAFYSEVVGFKRKYNEYFKLPNVIRGDIHTEPWREINVKEINPGITAWDDSGNDVLTQDTFQFFENDIANASIGTNSRTKKIWKDYTDLLINKNQAIKNVVYTSSQGIQPGSSSGIFVGGQNQILYLGQINCWAELPMNSGIENNATSWGEH